MRPDNSNRVRTAFWVPGDECREIPEVSARRSEVSARASFGISSESEVHVIP